MKKNTRTFACIILVVSSITCTFTARANWRCEGGVVPSVFSPTSFIALNPDSIWFFNLGRGKDGYIDDGWGSVSIAVERSGRWETVEFDRNNQFVDDNFVHHASVYGPLNSKLRGLFHHGSRATLSVRDREGYKIKVEDFSLRGYQKANRECPNTNYTCSTDGCKKSGR